MNDNLDNLEWISSKDNLIHAQNNDLLNTYYKRFKE